MLLGTFFASEVARIESHEQLAARCKPFLGLSFGNATAPSIASLGPMCLSQQAFTCCSLSHAEQLATWSAACQDAAPEHLSCCADIIRLRCFGCDGAAAIGMGRPVCKSFADKLWASCGDVFLTADSAPVEGAWPSMCSKDALLCSRFDEMWGSVDAFLTAVGLPQSLLPARGLDSPGCFDGASEAPPAEVQAAVAAAAAEAGLTHASAVDVAQKDRRRRERARTAADAAAAGDDASRSGSGNGGAGMIDGLMRSLRIGLYSALLPVLGASAASFIAARLETLLLGSLLLLLVPLVAGRGLTARRATVYASGLSDAEVRARRAAALRAAAGSTSAVPAAAAEGEPTKESSDEAHYDSDLE